MKFILITWISLLTANCLTTKIIDKAYPGAVPIQIGAIKSIDLGKDLVIRFHIDTGWQGIQQKCIQFQKDSIGYRAEVRADKVFSCENFQLLESDLQKKEIKNANGILILPSHVDQLVDMRNFDLFNFLENYSYSQFPKMNLKHADIDSKKNSIFLVNDENQYIMIKRYEEWNKKILYVYSYLEKIEAPYLKFLSNTLKDNKVEYPKEKNTKLPLIPISKPVLVLYYHLDEPQRESQKIVLEISKLNTENFYSLHLDMRSLYEGYAPWYLGLTPITAVLDFATLPFQAVYFIAYIAAKGSIHH